MTTGIDRQCYVSYECPQPLSLQTNTDPTDHVNSVCCLRLNKRVQCIIKLTGSAYFY